MAVRFAVSCNRPFRGRPHEKPAQTPCSMVCRAERIAPAALSIGASSPSAWRSGALPELGTVASYGLGRLRGSIVSTAHAHDLGLDVVRDRLASNVLALGGNARKVGTPCIGGRA